MNQIYPRFLQFLTTILVSMVSSNEEMIVQHKIKGNWLIFYNKGMKYLLEEKDTYNLKKMYILFKYTQAFDKMSRELFDYFKTKGLGYVENKEGS